MRIRVQFAGIFFFLLAIAGYAGLSSLQLDYYINDKFLHFLTFFALTIVFYWIVDTNRRRTLHFTLAVCTGILGVGSEFVQAVIPNGRQFDVYDIVANIVGSLSGLALCSWYHNRMLERKRRRRGLSTGEEGEGDALVGGDMDIELGEAGGMNGSSDAPPQETGVTAGPSTINGTGKSKTLEERVDEWDENAPDDAWGEADDIEEEDITASAGGPKNADSKRRD